jgi:hypothetical protein
MTLSFPFSHKEDAWVVMVFWLFCGAVLSRGGGSFFYCGKRWQSRFVLAGEIFLTGVTNLCAFLEVLLHIVEKLEEIRGLSCS